MNHLLAAPINHLLAQSHWARERLQAHAGQTFCIAGGPLSIRLQVGSDGYLGKPDRAEDDVLITLPADTPARLFFARETVFSEATLQGRADFSETLGFVFRNLRWDAEADVAKLTGDILAVRLVRACGDFFQWQQENVRRLTTNWTEYLTEEARLLPQANELAALKPDIAALGNATQTLEARLQRLGG